MKLLVIGGSGFIGSALIPQALAQGHEVAVLNRGHRPMADVRQIVADRSQPGQMQAVAEPFDAVIDLSAYTAQASAEALKAFGKLTSRWIHLSSAAVYVDGATSAPSESCPIGGAAIWGSYGSDKAAIDSFLLKEAANKSVILRPPYLYGPNNNIERESFIWTRCLNKWKIAIPGNNTAKIQFLHVDDLAQALLYFAQEGKDHSGVFNVAAPEEIGLQEWVGLLGDICGAPPTLVDGGEALRGQAARSYFPFRDADCRVAIQKILQHTDWRPRYSLEDGFRQTFASKTRAHWQEASARTDVERDLL
ncbi:NAD-dependent epimerase/dehydratase family protein [Polycladidibacter hongkongensis]|uniref:NAD-dependent epimerase/dehydratase family protein n=1 Tax=Polycladidibacter hongkongensis TaxID=1647556 RepID=UPI0008375D08|nr:NAD-dependent epimerase/dehydratase family protein [Pseudovibrio hongkongensis]